MVPFAAAGILLWAVAGLVLLFFRDWLARHHHTGWLWTCLAGVLCGFVGLGTMIRRDSRRHQRRDPQAR